MNLKKMAQWGMIMTALIAGENASAQNNQDTCDPYINTILKLDEKPSILVREHSILENEDTQSENKMHSILSWEHSIVVEPHSILENPLTTEKRHVPEEWKERIIERRIMRNPKPVTGQHEIQWKTIPQQDGKGDGVSQPTPIVHPVPVMYPEGSYCPMPRQNRSR